MINEQDILKRASERLSSIQKNIAQMKESRIEEKYVIEFHSVLGKLEGVGIDVSEKGEFRP
ncbi:unnamed protein product, partial [marine sediment metagenome]